jgi:translation initiation factor IF-3
VAFINKRSLINEQIKASQVRLIGSDGQQLGIMSLSSALNIASEEHLDLVEIASEANPPVCKIMDFGKYKFEREKREKESKKKQHIVELKEIQLRCRIETHDFETKLKHAHRFLNDGNKVKVVLKFISREIAHPERGAEVLERFIKGCEEICSVEKAPLLDGRNMIMILAPKKQNAQQSKAKKGNDQNG